MTSPKADPKFSSLKLSQDLLQVVDELGYQAMTPVQAQSIPALLQGKDVIGQSKTGSGKTAAFSLPILNALRLPGRRLQALILCPTRELCAQVAREMRRLGRRRAGLHVLVVAGGMPSMPQRLALEKGVHVVVGTPGRVLDFVGRGKIDLDGIRCVVLDEADRMLDMGFRDDIDQILGATPKSRQTVFFSATFPATIDDMSRAYQKDPVRVRAGGDDVKTANKVDQSIFPTAKDEKPQALLGLLRQLEPESAIVFCNHKITVDQLATTMNDAGFSAAAIHGGLEQRDRDRVMAKFRGHSVRVLVATDVAARGLDIEHLDVVFNYDLPQNSDTYVHRVGRTGRAGRSGVAISLVTPGDRERVRGIEMVVGIKLARFAGEAPAPRTAKPAAALATSAMTTLYIGGGRKEKVRPSDILGALTGEAAGLQGSQIGKIEIHDHFAYVAVATDVAQAALAGLRDGTIKGRKFQVELVR